MNKDGTKKTEVLFLLALKQKARRNQSAPESLTEEDFPALFEQSAQSEAVEMRRLLSDYQSKSESERADWRGKIEASIGADEPFIDENAHRSHIDNALKREVPAIRKIIAAALSGAEASAPPDRKRRFLEKSIRRAFAARFVSLAEVENATAFDRLSGAHLARLVRLAGVREVSTACLRIEAVEAVAAFIRNFPPEDARMIAAHLANVPEFSEERIAFAEKLVHKAFEIEPNPSAMLDWLGIRLTGILLCKSSKTRIRYTQQKLPLEFALGLPEMIKENCRRTPPEMQDEIGGGIERLAVTIAETN